MIKYVPHHQIDRKKYDHCVENSIQSRIYAFSWYLDAITEKWDVLVEGDYQSVMPLPRRTKYGIKYIYRPAWIQQLGIFSLKELPVKTEIEFLKYVSKKFLWIDYNMNSENRLDQKYMILKKNYILPLNRVLDDIQSGYNKNRKRISKKDFGDITIDKEGNFDLFFTEYTNHQNSYLVSEESIEKLKNLCLKNQERVHIWNVIKAEQLIAGLIWLEDAKRLTYLVPFANETGKKLHIPTFLINELIQSFEGQNKVLDFEGSMVKGVENFYKSFGAQAEFYYQYRKRFFHNGL